ncbi:MAG: hypothetical protein K6E97_06365 [Treponema sp.]|jgi:hypothetical protein|nr:hypothetical protein [Treponema sp.]
MKKLIALLFVLSAFMMGITAQSADNYSPEDLLQQIVEITQPQLPTTFDDADSKVVLFGVNAEKKTITYSYAFAVKSDKSKTQDYYNAMKPALIEGLKADPSISTLLNSGAIFIYRYYGIDGKIVVEIKITKKDIQ